MADSTVTVPGQQSIDVTQTTPPVTSVALPNSTGAVEISASSLMVPPPEGVNPFTSLTDVPNSYIGFGLWLVRVNASGTALEFVDPAGFGGGGGGISDAASDGGYYARRNAAWVGLGSAATHAAGDFALAVHTHAASDVVSGTFTDARIAQSNVTQHQAALSINYSQMVGTLPALAITSTFLVASQAAQLALTAQEGDVAVRSDLNKSFIKNSGVAGTMADWQELLTPTDAVSSFNGRLGAVVPAANDYTWAQIGTKPTTLAGFGITDAESSAHATATYAAKATTLAGYGITDAAAKGAVNTFTRAQSVTPVALTSGGTVATDASLSNYFTLTLGANATLANPTNLVAGTTYLWVITQDGTGLRTMAYGSLFKCPGGSVPALTTTPGAVDLLSAFYDGTRLLCGLQKGFA